MVNVYIYLENESAAKKAALGLLEADLAAHVSIDKDNHSFMKKEGKVIKEVSYVLTLQTKALLFDKIVDYIQIHFGMEIKIYSLPITQCNTAFSEVIRHHTKTD